MMKMLPKIKNCRICGALGTLEQSVEYDVNMRAKRFCYVRCIGCNYKTRKCRTRTEAVKAWNERQDRK